MTRQKRQNINDDSNIIWIKPTRTRHNKGIYISISIEQGNESKQSRISFSFSDEAQKDLNINLGDRYFLGINKYNNNVIYLILNKNGYKVYQNSNASKQSRKYLKMPLDKYYKKNQIIITDDDVEADNDKLIFHIQNILGN